MPTFRIRIVADPTGVQAGKKQVERELTKLDNRADQLRATMGRLFALVGGITAVTRAIGVYARFEQTMASVAAVSGGTRSEIAALREESERLGATTRFSATQAAEGAELLSRAGFTAQQTLESLEGTLRLAQAGGLGLASAADITTAVLKGFQLSVSETGRVADVLSAAAANANTTVLQLGEGMKYVAPIAAGLKLSLETTTAAMQVLSNAGLQASMAGTGLRKVIADLSAPGAKLKSTILSAGVAIEDVDPKANKLADILARLRSAGINAGNAVEYFGLRGGPAFAVLSGGTDDLERFEADLLASTGKAKEMAKIMDENLNGALLAVKSALESVVIGLGNVEDSGLENFFRSLAATIRGVRGEIETFANVVESLVVLLSINLARKAIGFLIARLNALRLAFATNPLGAFVTLLVLATSLLVGFADEISVSENGLTTLKDVGTAAFKEIKFYAGELKIFLDAFFIGLSKIIDDTFGTDIGGSFRKLLLTVARVFDSIIGVASGTVAAVKELFGNSSTQIGASFELVFGTLKRQGEIAFKYLANIVSSVFQAPIATLAKTFQTFVGAIGGVAAVARSLGLITEDARQDFEDIITKLDVLAAKKGKGAKIDLPFSKEEIAGLEAERDRFIRETTEKVKAAREESIADVATRIRKAFAEGLAGSPAFLENTLKGIFEEADRIAAERERKRKTDLERQREEQRKKAGGGGVPGKAQQEEAKALSDTAKQLLAVIDINSKLISQEDALQEIYEKRPDLQARVVQAWEDLKLQALDASVAIGDGFERAFIRIRQEARDMASVAEDTIYTFVDNGSNALAEFVKSGKADFNSLANSIISDLIEIYTRLLLIQAINLGSTALGIGTPSFGGFRQHGGEVKPGRSYYVGEAGRERFTPTTPGTVQPAGGGEASVKVVNVYDEEELASVMNSPAGERVLMNVLRRNRTAARRILS